MQELLRTELSWVHDHFYTRSVKTNLQVRGTQASESLRLGPGFLGPAFKLLRELLLSLNLLVQSVCNEVFVNVNFNFY